MHGKVIKGRNLLQSFHSSQDLTRASSDELAEPRDSHVLTVPAHAGCGRAVMGKVARPGLELLGETNDKEGHWTEDI